MKILATNKEVATVVFGPPAVISKKMDIKRLLFVALGTLSLGIGMVGVFVPVLPTTPFLLLATSFYARGSAKFYNWLVKTRVLGAYVRQYIDGNGMALKVKLFTIGFMWAAILSTVIVVVEGLAMRIVLVLIGVGVSTHIALIKGSKKAKKEVATGGFGQPTKGL